MIIYGDTWVIERSLLPRYEHALVSLEGVLVPDEDDIACQFMSQNGDIVDGLDRFTAGGVDGKQGWELVSHDVVLVGTRTLTTFVFRRLVDVES